MRRALTARAVQEVLGPLLEEVWWFPFGISVDCAKFSARPTHFWEAALRHLTGKVAPRAAPASRRRHRAVLRRL